MYFHRRNLETFRANYGQKNWSSIGHLFKILKMKKELQFLVTPSVKAGGQRRIDFVPLSLCGMYFPPPENN